MAVTLPFYGLITVHNTYLITALALTVFQSVLKPTLLDGSHTLAITATLSFSIPYFQIIQSLIKLFPPYIA